MIKYVYEIDYPLGEKRKYLEWVRSIADTLEAPSELKRLASYDNAFSASPHRVVEFTFDSLEDAGRYFDRKEMVRIFQGDLPAHGTNIHIKVLTLRGDYSKDVAAGSGAAESEERTNLQSTTDDPMIDQSAVATPVQRGVDDDGQPARWADSVGSDEPETARFEPDASQ